MTVKTLLSKARALSIRERAELMDGLWQSFSEDDLSKLDGLFDEEDVKEWNRRSDEIDAHPERVLTWEQMQIRPTKR
jgi:putative addiction module component (TIGR02574 family)